MGGRTWTVPPLSSLGLLNRTATPHTPTPGVCHMTLCSTLPFLHRANHTFRRSHCKGKTYLTDQRATQNLISRTKPASSPSRHRHHCPSPSLPTSRLTPPSLISRRLPSRVFTPPHELTPMLNALRSPTILPRLLFLLHSLFLVKSRNESASHFENAPGRMANYCPARWAVPSSPCVNVEPHFQLPMSTQRPASPEQ